MSVNWHFKKISFVNSLSNQMLRVWYRYVPFQDLLPANGEQWYIKMSSWQFWKHPDICGQCRKLSELHWNVSMSSNRGEKSQNSINVIHSGSHSSIYVNRKTFFCDQFSYQSEIPIHVLTHNQNRHEQLQQNPNKHKGLQQTQLFNYSCDECNFTSLIKQAVFNHKQVANIALSYKCNKWDHQTISTAVFSSHTVRDDLFNCKKKCAKTFTGQQRLYYHTVYIHKQVDVVNYKCTICDHQTKFKNVILPHKNGDFEFCCKKCPKQFILKPSSIIKSDKQRLYYHMNRAHEQKYRC